MLNSCNFMGRLARDPQYFEGENTNRAVFTLAVDRDRKNAEGEYDTDFLDFVVWGSSADFLMKYFHKGDMVVTTNARAQVRSYTDSEGVPHRRIEFVCDRIHFGQAKRKEE